MIPGEREEMVTQIAIIAHLYHISRLSDREVPDTTCFLSIFGFLVWSSVVICVLKKR